jgi:hypothetical protein
MHRNIKSVAIQEWLMNPAFPVPECEKLLHAAA